MNSIFFFNNVRDFEYPFFYIVFKLLQVAYMCSYKHNYMHYFHYSFS